MKHYKVVFMEKLFLCKNENNIFVHRKDREKIS